MKSKRRPPFFWDQYNDWARQHYDETGKKPRVATIKQWFDDNAETVWPEPALRPTFLETKRHSKGVRPKANIRAYFRRYRQQRRASRRRRHQRRSLGSGSDGSVSSDSSSGSDEDDEDDDAEEDNSAEDSGTDAEGHEEGALRVKHGDTEVAEGRSELRTGAGQAVPRRAAAPRTRPAAARQRRHGGAQHPGSTHKSSDDSSPKEYNDDEDGPEEHQVPQDRHEVQPQAKVRSVVPDHSCGPKAPLSETVAAAVAPAPAPAAADTGAGSAGPAAAAEADSSAAPSARPPRRAAAAAASQTWRKPSGSGAAKVAVAAAAVTAGAAAATAAIAAGGAVCNGTKGTTAGRPAAAPLPPSGAATGNTGPRRTSVPVPSASTAAGALPVAQAAVPVPPRAQPASGGLPAASGVPVAAAADRSLPDSAVAGSSDQREEGSRQGTTEPPGAGKDLNTLHHRRKTIAWQQQLQGSNPLPRPAQQQLQQHPQQRHDQEGMVVETAGGQPGAASAGGLGCDGGGEHGTLEAGQPAYRSARMRGKKSCASSPLFSPLQPLKSSKRASNASAHPSSAKATAAMAAAAGGSATLPAAAAATRRRRHLSAASANDARAFMTAAAEAIAASAAAAAAVAAAAMPGGGDAGPQAPLLLPMPGRSAGVEDAGRLVADGPGGGLAAGAGALLPFTAVAGADPRETAARVAAAILYGAQNAADAAAAAAVVNAAAAAQKISSAEAMLGASTMSADGAAGAGGPSGSSAAGNGTFPYHYGASENFGTGSSSGSAAKGNKGPRQGRRRRSLANIGNLAAAAEAADAVAAWPQGRRSVGDGGAGFGISGVGTSGAATGSLVGLGAARSPPLFTSGRDSSAYNLQLQQHLLHSQQQQQQLEEQRRVQHPPQEQSHDHHFLLRMVRSRAPSSNDDLLYDMVMSRNGGGAGGLRASPRDGAAAAAGMSPASLLQQSMPPPPARLPQQSMLATGLLPAGGSLRKRAGSNDGSAALDHAGGRGAAGDAGGLDEQVGPRAVRKQRVVRFSFGEVTALDEVGTGAAVGMAATDARQQAAEGRHYTGTPGGGGAEAGGGATGAAQQEAAAGEAELNTGQSNVVSAFGSLASEPGLSRDAGQQAAAGAGAAPTGVVGARQKNSTPPEGNMNAAAGAAAAPGGSGGRHSGPSGGAGPGSVTPAPRLRGALGTVFSGGMLPPGLEEAEAAWEDGSLADALGFGSARSLQNSILRLAGLGSATPGGLLASCRLARQASVDWNELLNPRLSEGLDLFGFCYSSQPSATKPRLSGGAPYEAAELATSGAAGAGLAGAAGAAGGAGGSGQQQQQPLQQQLVKQEQEESNAGAGLVADRLGPVRAALGPAGIGGAVFGGSATGAAGLSGPAVGAGAAGTYDINAGTAWRTQQHHLLSQPPQQQHLIHQSKQQQQAIAGHQGWGAAGRGGAAWDLLLGSNQSQPRQQLQHLQQQHQQTTSATAAVAAIATLRAGAYEDPYHQARPAATLQYQYQQAHADILQQLHLRAHSAAAAAASTASGVAGASSAAWGGGSANVVSGYGLPQAQQQALGALGLVTADGSGQYAATGSAAAAVPRAAQLGLELGVLLAGGGGGGGAYGNGAGYGAGNGPPGGYGHSRIYGSGDLNAGGSLRQQHQQHQQLQHYPNLPPAWPQATAPPASEGWAAAMGAALRLAGGGGPSAAEAAPLQHQGGAPGSGTDGGSAGAVLMPHRAVSTGGSALTTEDASEMSETSQGGARGSYGYDTGAY